MSKNDAPPNSDPSRNTGEANVALPPADIGSVVSGSQLEGLRVRLNPATSVEDVRIGRFVVAQGKRFEFFGTVHDVGLASSDPDALIRPLPQGLAGRALAASSMWGELDVRMKLIHDEDSIKPARTVPEHFSAVREARDEDVAAVFGTEDDTHMFIGTPLDMSAPVCIDLEKLVMRSNGVFGKTGTGKSFITRMLLAGMIKAQLASVLVFDMHNEYGMFSTDEARGKRADGLKTMFGDLVSVFSCDPVSSLQRRAQPDFEIEIAMADIEIGDIKLMRGELGLSDAQLRDAEMLADKLGRNWMAELLDALESGDIIEMAASVSANENSTTTLARNLKRLERLTFVKRAVMDKSAKRIVAHLAEGRHVVVEFGRKEALLEYGLVASVLTRRIHHEWQRLKEKALSEDLTGTPPQLVIVLEEAHKFLSPEASSQTIFGTIAREMRKYNVTLLVVDQRPSGIDEEVASQFGTRIIAALDDERDRSSVLTGLADSRALSGLVSNLDPSRQVLIGGFATPMPIVIEVRDYYEFTKSVKSDRKTLNLWAK